MYNNKILEIDLNIDKCLIYINALKNVSLNSELNSKLKSINEIGFIFLMTHKLEIDCILFML